MEYIATAALIVIAGCAVWFTRAVFEFMKRPLPILNVNVLFNPEIVELIRNWRRSPRAKKETV